MRTNCNYLGQDQAHFFFLLGPPIQAWLTWYSDLVTLFNWAFVLPARGLKRSKRCIYPSLSRHVNEQHWPFSTIFISETASGFKWTNCCSCPQVLLEGFSDACFWPLWEQDARRGESLILTSSQGHLLMSLGCRYKTETGYSRPTHVEYKGISRELFSMQSSAR